MDNPVLEEFSRRFFMEAAPTTEKGRQIQLSAAQHLEAQMGESTMFADAGADILCGLHPISANCIDAGHLHAHNYFELIYVYRGQCKQYFPKCITTMQQGSFCLLNTNARHGIAIDSEQNIVFNIMISRSFFDRIFSNLVPRESILNRFFWDSMFSDSERQYILFEANEHSQSESFIQSLLTEYIQKPLGYNQAMAAYLSLLFSELMRNHLYHLERTAGKEFHYMELIDYIGQHLNDVTLNSLAEEFHYSPAYLSRTIKRFANHTFSELLLQMRLARAADYLERSDLSIDRIVEQLGFYDRSHFNKVFKKQFGVSPNEYRKQRTAEGTEKRADQG